jgi:hypothetical protein
MAAVGVVFVVLVAIAVLIGLYVLVVSLPDIARYRRVRRM